MEKPTKKWSTLGPAYEILEQRRPEHCIPHHEAVFMCSLEDIQQSDYEIDDAGGGNKFICHLMPEGPVQRYDLNWMSAAQGLFTQMEEQGDELGWKKELEILSEIEECVDGYWSGLPSCDEPLWECLTRSAKVLECTPDDDYDYDGDDNSSGMKP